MGNRTLKYGGKSGILPKPRAIFKSNPIKPMTEQEKAHHASIEQGYADSVPLPVKKGFSFHRKVEPKKVVTVEERIRKTIDERTPKNVDTTQLKDEEIWKLKVGDIRREHLRTAYLKEYERLKKIDELEAKRAAEAKQAEQSKQEYEETEATKLTLPTIESYLQGPIMRQRTPTEQALLEHKRAFNRKSRELEVKESRAEQLLGLYHQASSFVTTEAQLEKAITEAFEIRLNKFNLSAMSVKDRLNGSKDSNVTLSENEDAILDAAHGQINRKPGLNVVRDTIDGELEKLKRQAEIAIHNNQY
ncbi:hypothetical protein PSN45_004727 [Yamadazyma tenuis]|uniref:Uncharacterized protein n=1 Tax=Candida tenuis (strain ATCC 10573 / BCRC 21748 / CBS 615 / JCM 9827 / NBRC 10315 / NRRL Y-1498 / VKM Y-70) TaxID=590646 RepID=G3B6S0_CANTC|nr:uncharacterized protein CANTEDRAFT_114313 [Yamadazyma tenuis ATCC 10573]EGV63002.1 hypothetical protein CANTEDRAFT_114313 [Yamadazyma tenuis ATCC 10573]WEJ97179.1 hypothetical protein PSN45_004727 [Yamadazyma tenuis]